MKQCSVFVVERGGVEKSGLGVVSYKCASSLDHKNDALSRGNIEA